MKKMLARLFALLLCGALLLPALPFVTAAEPAADPDGAVLTAENTVITLDRDSFFYNRNLQQPAVTSVKVNGTELQPGTDYGISYRAASVFAGNYYVDIVGRAPYSGTVTAQYTILPCPVIVTWDTEVDFLYDFNPHAPAVQLQELGSTLPFPTADYLLMYKQRDAQDSTYTYEMPTLPGDYTACVHLGSNFRADSPVTCDFSIGWADLAAPTVQGEAGIGGWYRSADLIAADGTGISLQPRAVYKPSLTLSDGVHTDTPVYIRDLSTRVMGRYLLSCKVDSVPPTASVTVGENVWNTRLNAITFDLFFKNTRSVTISAADARSGVHTVDYAVTAGSIPAEADWRGYNGTFSIAPTRKAVVWARVRDMAGNETIVNSNGMVLYADPTTDTAALSYTRGSREDVTFPVLLNGSTVKDVKLNGFAALLHTVSAADANGMATVTLDGDYLDSFAADDYTVVLSFDPMGESYVDADGNAAPAELTVPLTVKKFAPIPEPFSVDDHVYDGWGAPVFGVVVNDWGGNTGLSLYSVTEYKVQGASDDTWTETAPTDVGNYTVRITIPETDRTEAIVVMADYAITPRTVYIYDVFAADKHYDGTNAVTDFSLGDPWEFVDGDDVALDTTNATAAFATADVGEYLPIVISGYSLVGADAHNYVLLLPPLYADITPLDIASADVTVENATFTYDGSEKALALTSVTVNGLDATYTLSGDKAAQVGAYTATLTGTGNFTGTLAVDYAILPDTAPLTGLTGDSVKLSHREALEQLLEQLKDITQSDSDAISRGRRDELAAAQNALETDILPGLDAWEELVAPVPDAVDSLPEAIPDDPDAVAALDDLNEALAHLTDEEQQRFSREFPAEAEAAAAFIAAMTDYRFLSGDGQHHSLLTDRDKAAVFKVNGHHEKLQAVRIDDVTLAPADYTVEAGSTVITLEAACLNALSVAPHVITAVYTDGEAHALLIVCDDTCPNYEAPESDNAGSAPESDNADGAPESDNTDGAPESDNTGGAPESDNAGGAAEKTPDTGDHARVWLWALLCLLPAASLALLLRFRRGMRR